MTDPTPAIDLSADEKAEVARFGIHDETDNEKLVEEAAATIAVAELVRTHRTWGDLIEPQKDEYRRVARAVLAVFEKAHTPTTPTDDEREALITDVEQWNETLTHAMPATETLMARLARYVRRSSDTLAAATAAKELWRVRCAEETIAWADEAAENRLLHSVAQGEPSDAQVDAACAEIAARMNYKVQPTRGTMRAALRAAGVGGEGR